MGKSKITRNRLNQEIDGLSAAVEDGKAFLEEEQDYSESVSALERAIAVMKKQDYDRPAAAAVLLQLTDADSRVPQQAKSIIATFLSLMGGDASQAKSFEDPMD